MGVTDIFKKISVV